MCGLIGFYPKENRQVDLEKFLQIILGSQSRGEDNTGIAIGNIYFSKLAGNANNFFSLKYRELKELDTQGFLINEPIIAHVRKASERHKLAAKHGHPFSWNLTDRDTQALTNYFFGIHNGTISNDYEMHTKYIKCYEPDSQKYTTHEIDSEVILDSLFKAILYNPLDIKEILEFYKGAASLLFYTKDAFYAWKGIEKLERPLYYVETEEGWYFCSIDSLLQLFDTKYNVINATDNTLLVFKDYQLAESHTFTRTEFTHHTNYGGYLPPKTTYGGYNAYGEDDYGYGYSATPKTTYPTTTVKKSTTTHTVPIKETTKKANLQKENKEKNIFKNVQLTTNGLIVNKNKDLLMYVPTGWYSVTNDNTLTLLNEDSLNISKKRYVSQSCLFLNKCPIEVNLIGRNKLADKTKQLYKLSTEYRTSSEPSKILGQISDLLDYINPYLDTVLPLYGVTTDHNIYIKAIIIRDDNKQIHFVGPHISNVKNYKFSFLNKKYEVVCKNLINNTFSKIELIEIE